MLDRVELMQTHDSDALVRLLDRAAAVLEACAADFLHGDEDAFARAKALRSARSAEANRQARTAPYVADADRAWERKDYRTVHALLEPIRNDLDATHRRRLDFAARRL